MGPTIPTSPEAYFADMIEHCLAHAESAKAQHRPVVGMLCEFTPRELILAAGGVPVCLCGGDVDMIAPAQRDLPANLCPLIKSTYGYHVSGENPFLEMADLIVAETTCDGKKKMYELMAARRPMYVLELPQKPDEPAAMAHWQQELRKFHAYLQTRFGRAIPDEAIRAAIGVMNRERSLRRSLAELMLADQPPLSGRQLLAYKSSISGIPADLAMYEQALAQLPQHPTRKPRSHVRVLLTGVPVVHGAERVVEIIEGAGGLIVCMENCTGIKPILEDVDESAADPIAALAEKYFHLPCSVMTPNARRLEQIEALARKYRADCVVELVWQACLTYSVESALVRRVVEEKLHLPYLYIETDYSPSDSARITTRVEALLETARGDA